MPSLKHVFAALLFVLPLICFAQKDAVKIPWGTSLTWKDFKAQPDKSSPYLASTYSGFSFSYSYKMEGGEPEFTYEVKTNFYPDRSWLKPGNGTKKLLGHEQLHFDISELYARKFKQYLASVGQNLDSRKMKGEIKRQAHLFERKRKRTENFTTVKPNTEFYQKNRLSGKLKLGRN